MSHLEDLASHAIGVQSVLEIGKSRHWEIAKKHPNAKIYMGAGPPDSVNARRIKYSPTHIEVNEFLSRNEFVIFELFLSEIVQSWFDFLKNIYHFTVEQNLLGNNEYTPPKNEIQFEYDEYAQKGSEHIIDASLRKFEFLEAKEKLRIVRVGLNKDCSALENEILTIRTNITIRNCLQHNEGVLSAEDLRRLGIQAISMDMGTYVDEYAEGEKISRSGYDIEELVVAMAAVAAELTNVPYRDL